MITHRLQTGPYNPENLPPVDAENPPEDWEECGCCGGYHPTTSHADCRDPYNRWPSHITTGEC